jgi:positive regulator of sigma E activity
MIARTGRILSIADGVATIRVEAPSACSACGSRNICGGKAFELTRPVDAHVRAGDGITLAIEAGTLTHGALLAYFLPAATTLFGALALAHIGDLAAVAGALSGLGLGLILQRHLGHRSACRSTAIAVLPAPTFSQSTGEAP